MYTIPPPPNGWRLSGEGKAKALLTRHGQVEKALVSWMGWKAVFSGFVWVFIAPVWRSVTVRTTLTLVKPPANTHFRPFTEHPSRALATISTFDELKNQK
jgi:hypothetical protein